jgi:hypothetical protein
MSSGTLRLCILLDLQRVNNENQQLRAELDYLRQEHHRQMEQADKRHSNLVSDYDRGREVSTKLYTSHS